MSYRNERLNKSMKSLEDSAQGIDMSKWRVLSDLGVGVERMVEAIDGEACAGGRRTTDGEACAGNRRTTGEASCACPHAQINWRGRSDLARQFDDDREDKLFEAEMRLADAGKSYLIRVLLLIVENGADREISLRSVPRRTYFRHREELLDFFTEGLRSRSTAAGTEPGPPSSWHSAAHGDIEGV